MLPEVEQLLIQASTDTQKGDVESAETLCRQALALQETSDGYSVLASVFAAMSQPEQACEAFEAALALNDDNVMALNNYARLLRRTGDLSAAIEIYRRAVKLSPDTVEIRKNLTRTLASAGRTRDAVKTARETVRRDRGDVDARLILATALMEDGKLDEARSQIENVLAAEPDNGGAFTSLANIESRMGDSEASCDAYKQAVSLNPSAELHSAYITSLNYVEGAVPAEVLAEGRRWSGLYTGDVEYRDSWPAIAFEPERKLRVGFVSGDFRNSSTPFLVLPMLDHRQADQWELYCYATRQDSDRMTETFRDHADGWRNIYDLSDDQAAAQIAEDAIDVLVDMNGHTFGNRLMVFARKPAPVQIRWINNVATSGMDRFDYLLGDPIHTPMDDQSCYSETLCQLPLSYIRYRPPNDGPAVAPAPAAKNGYVTFGSFNSAFKISPSNIAAWSEILNRTPETRLLLNSREYAVKETRSRFQKLFAGHGIDRKRLEFVPGSSDHRAFLTGYGRVDVGLDTFPYSGGLTTSEAVYMGVPVITFPGDRFCSRHATSHLTAIGMTDWVAEDQRSYIELALSMAQNPDRLVADRMGWRDKLLSSGLTNGRSLAEGFSQILRQAWQEACRSYS